jgi:hypothetical protein
MDTKPLDFECPKTVKGLIAEYSALVTSLMDEGRDVCSAQDEAGRLMSEKYDKEILCVLPWFADFDY